MTINVVKTPCPHCGGRGFTETKTKTVTVVKEEPVYTGHNYRGSNIEGTADELSAKGYRQTQFGWFNGPVGNTD
jgi:DnaJ-class molecular chaperone